MKSAKTLSFGLAIIIAASTGTACADSIFTKIFKKNPKKHRHVGHACKCCKKAPISKAKKLVGSLGYPLFGTGTGAATLVFVAGSLFCLYNAALRTFGKDEKSKKKLDDQEEMEKHPFFLARWEANNKTFVGIQLGLAIVSGVAAVGTGYLTKRMFSNVLKNLK